jgi:hypothetical protein
VVAGGLSPPQTPLLGGCRPKQNPCYSNLGSAGALVTVVNGSGGPSLDRFCPTPGGREAKIGPKMGPRSRVRLLLRPRRAQFLAPLRHNALWGPAVPRFGCARDLGVVDVTKPYKFICFGAMYVTKPYRFIRFIGFGAVHVTKPYKCIRFGAMDVTRPYKLIRFGAMDVTVRDASAPGSRVIRSVPA